MDNDDEEVDREMRRRGERDMRKCTKPEIEK